MASLMSSKLMTVSADKYSCSYQTGAVVAAVPLFVTIHETCVSLPENACTGGVMLLMNRFATGGKSTSIDVSSIVVLSPSPSNSLTSLEVSVVT